MRSATARKGKRTTAITSAPALLVASSVRHQLTEGHVIILSASTICPSPEQCDLRSDESYEEYVRRHILDHHIPATDPLTNAPWSLADAERNLSLWCLYYFHKWTQGNMSLLPDPCWQDADFLANGRFTDADLEVGVEWNDRTFSLRPYAERDLTAARYKRMRKMTKVRETQKSSWCKAFVTWRHLRAYFVENNIYFRVMVISAFSDLARDTYLEVFSNMWAQHYKLVELFGMIEHTKRWNEDDPDESEERVVALLDWKKAKLKNGLQLRWNINSKTNTGQTATSFFIAGAGSGTTGRRWDLIIVDDPCVVENSGTDKQRAKVARKSAELRKQLSAVGELIWLNTPHHLSDASAQIDEKFPDEFHILYRPGRWGAAGNYKFYWEYDGLCGVDVNALRRDGTIQRADATGVKCERPRHEHGDAHVLAPHPTYPCGVITDHPFMGRVVWDEARIDKEERQLDFYSQVLLLVRNEENALFHEKDFIMLRTRDAPEEIRFGLGRPLSEDEDQLLRHMKREIRAYTQIDTAGKAEQTDRGDRNCCVGVRFDADWNIVVTHLRYGYWSATQEVEEMWIACVRNQQDSFEYEVSGAHEKYVRAAVTDFEARKSNEMKRPVSLGITYINASEGTSDSKNKRIERCQAYTSTGRVRILEDAGSEEDIALFKREFCEFPWSDHDDGPDAFSRILKRIDAFGYKPAPKPDEPVPLPMEYNAETGTLTIEAAMWQSVVDSVDGGGRGWADQGRYAENETTEWIDNDSVPGNASRKRNVA